MKGKKKASRPKIAARMYSFHHHLTSSDSTTLRPIGEVNSSGDEIDSEYLKEL